MFFSKALLNATYTNGIPGRPTVAHEKAEHHRFKKDFLYKKPIISKEIYASRLIQQFLINRAIELKLQALTGGAKEELNAFFTLSYLNELWRAPAMEEDLRLLDVDPENIKKQQITPTTHRYLAQIETLEPKELLAHFLLHVVGFMHGGALIQHRYIKPSNKETTYQIPSNQYDFSAAISVVGKGDSVMNLYGDLMKEVDKIPLSEHEYQQILTQSQGIYETMASIYDDLCLMHTKQLKLPILALCAVAIAGIAICITKMMNGLDINEYLPKPY